MIVQLPKVRIIVMHTMDHVVHSVFPHEIVILTRINTDANFMLYHEDVTELEADRTITRNQDGVLKTVNDELYKRSLTPVNLDDEWESLKKRYRRSHEVAGQYWCEVAFGSKPQFFEWAESDKGDVLLAMLRQKAGLGPDERNISPLIVDNVQVFEDPAVVDAGREPIESLEGIKPNIVEKVVVGEPEPEPEPEPFAGPVQDTDPPPDPEGEMPSRKAQLQEMAQRLGIKIRPSWQLGRLRTVVGAAIVEMHEHQGKELPETIDLETQKGVEAAFAMLFGSEAAKQV